MSTDYRPRRFRIADDAVPDAKAQIWVESRQFPIIDASRIAVYREEDGPTGAAAVLPKEWLVEVKPPSIDDPVTLPLDIPMLQLKELPRVTLRLSPVGHDSAVDVAMLGNDGHEGYLEGRIWGDDLLRLAQAAWQAWQRANAIEAKP